MKALDSRFETLAKYVELADLDEVKGQIGSAPLIVVINRSVVTLEDSADGVHIGRPPGGAASAVYDSLRQAGGGIVVVVDCLGSRDPRVTGRNLRTRRSLRWVVEGC